MKLFIVLIGGKGHTSLVNPQVVLLRDAILGFPQSFYRDVQSVSLLCYLDLGCWT